MKETPTTPATARPSLPSGIKSRVKALVQALCTGLYERDEVMKLALLCSIAGESMFLHGPPGVGKSLIARRLKYAFNDGKTFEYLMTRFSTPDEVFGPISIKRLKEDDRYERLTENYMPDASVVFLDEIWKSSSSIQNALLTIINERVFRNGSREEPVNIRAILTASNELPPAGESFGPLWDRLLVRYDVGSIRSGSHFRSMITDTTEVYSDPVSGELKISQAECDNWRRQARNILVPEEVLASLEAIKARIEQWNAKKGSASPLLIYDRRWKKIVLLLRMSALLNEREEVDLMDLFLAVHCLWNTPEHIPVLREIIARTIREFGYSLALPLGQFIKEVDAFEAEVLEETTVQLTEEREVLTPIDEVWYQLVKLDAQFEGVYIKVNDFNKLQIDAFEVTNLYDTSGNLVNRLSAAKGSGAFSVVVKYNSIDHPYRLVTHKAESKRRIKRQPHQHLIDHWNQRHKAVAADLHRAQEKLRSVTPGHWEGMHEHLFSSAHLAPLVKANLEEVTEQLHQLHLQLEKVRYTYEQG